MSADFIQVRYSQLATEIPHPGVEILFEALSDSGERVEAPIVLGTHTIGRESTCDIVIRSARVSRFHAVVVLTESGVLVNDRGSRNGLLIGGKKVAYARLDFRQFFTLGDVHLCFYPMRLPVDPAPQPEKGEVNRASPTQPMGQKLRKRLQAETAKRL